MPNNIFVFQERAQKLEAMSRTYEDKLAQDILGGGVKRGNSLDRISHRKSVAIISWCASLFTSLKDFRRWTSAENMWEPTEPWLLKPFREGAVFFSLLCLALWASWPAAAPVKARSCQNCELFLSHRVPLWHLANPLEMSLRGCMWKFARNPLFRIKYRWNAINPNVL